MNKKFLSVISIVFYFSIILITVSAVSAADTTPPKVMGTDPGNHAVSVPTNKNVAIRFSENIKAGNGYVTLKNSRGSIIPITKSISGHYLLIKHSKTLARGIKYVVTLHTGSVKDMTGNKVRTYSTSFTTDNTRPRVLAVSPRNGAYKVATNTMIYVKFTEAIRPVTGFIELKSSSGASIPITKTIVGRCLYVRHSTTLNRGTSYNLILHTNSIKDISGNGIRSYTTKFLTENGLNPNAPSKTVKLLFIHHSCGENWLSNGNGNLGAALNKNHYYVTDTYYGWSAQPGDSLGDRTDTVNWPEWFTAAKMPYVYGNNQHYSYTNTISNPGGENDIIMFKSCYPNSEVGDSISDEKAIYNQIKNYFAAHPKKLFVLITPPGTQHVSSYRLTQSLCNWLVSKDGWLKGYTGKNIMVFDLYGVLSEANSHHRYHNGVIQHVYASNYDGISPYHSGDDHPNAMGNQKATNEFISLLNIAYHVWKG